MIYYGSWHLFCFVCRLVHVTYLMTSIPDWKLKKYCTHSMAKANMNKSKRFWQILPQHQSTYIIKRGPESESIETRPYFTTFSHLEVLLQIKFGSEREVFQLMQIMGLLGLYFNAAVVFVKNFSLLFRLALVILCTPVYRGLKM